VAEEGKAKKVALGVGVGIGLCGCLSVPVIGILAAIAIPSFLGYVNRSKTAEAETNLTILSQQLEVYRIEFGTFPVRSMARTPPGPVCEKQMWPYDADPQWLEVGFEPYDPLYFSYEYIGDPSGETYTLRAYADLDCDGLESLYERVPLQPQLYIENGLE
jgi:hypothetical protein